MTKITEVIESAGDPKRPFVTVILVVRNGGDYIAPQIDSILEQTYSNLELIICDDCSTDKTPQVAQEYVRRDSRVRYARNEPNLRQSLSFEKHCHLCRGALIFAADGDDVWLPKKIEKQVAYMVAHPEIHMVITDEMIANQDLSQKMGSLHEKFGHHSRGETISIEHLLKRNIVSFHVCCFRREMLPKMLPVPDQSIFMVDSWAAIVCSLTAPIGYINECLVLYRQHQTNYTGAGTRDALFYLGRLNDSNFVKEYIMDKSGQMSVHKRLLGMEASTEARAALTEKIAIQTALLAVAEAPSLTEFVSKLVAAAWTIIKSHQKYHFQQWAFLALSWGAIQKVRLQNRPTVKIA